MRGSGFVWTDAKLKQGWHRAYALGGITPAARELGCSDAALRSALQERGIRWREAPPDAAPASAGVEVSAPPPTPIPPEPDDAPVVLDWAGARPKVASSSGTERRLVFADPHIPFHDLVACTALLALARAIQPHRVICLGDFMNNGAVSHHPRPLGGREQHGPAVAMGAAFLSALRKAVPGSTIHLLAGNHDDWSDEYEDEHPEFRGLFAGQRLFGLDALEIEWVPREAQPLILGPIGYRHGTGGGEHFCKRYAERDAVLADVKCMVVGHHHAAQHYVARNSRQAWGVPAMAKWDIRANRNFDYARKGGEPAHWQPGALVEDVNGGHFSHTPVRLADGQAFFGGRVIAA